MIRILKREWRAAAGEQVSAWVVDWRDKADIGFRRAFSDRAGAVEFAADLARSRRAPGSDPERAQ